MRVAALRRALCVALLVATAAAARSDEPQIPTPRGYVNDFAHVIDPQTAAHLEQLIQELRQKTGAEIAVVTVRSTQPLSAFDYALAVAERWKPGAARQNNGVVFLVAVEDRALFILTGYGIEGALPDGRVGEVRDTVVVPRFKQGDYAGGIRAGTEALAAIVAKEYNVALTGAPAYRPQARGGGQSIPVPAIILFVVVLLLLSRTGLWPLLFMGGPAYGPRRRDGGFFGGSFGGGGFGGGGSGGGGFGGFGGGSFGGGGAGGNW